MTQENIESNNINTNAIAVRYGLMTGFILMFITTINFLYILNLNYIAFVIFGFLLFIVPIIFYFIVAFKQKKLLGGTISLKSAFQAIFIVIIISTLISAVYGIIYNDYIDPECVSRMKSSMETFFIKSKMTQDKIDEILKRVDDAAKSSTSISKMALGLGQGIIFQSIFGFITALIVSRKKQQNINL